MKKWISYIGYLLAIAVMVSIDQISKLWMVNNLKGKENIVWIKNVFELEYLENNGAAFSSFMGKQGFLITITFIILAFVVFKWLQIPQGKRFIGFRFTFALLIAGAIGNLIDRMVQGYVVDFFYFKPINFPRFNVADCYVCVAMALLAVLIFFVYKDEESDFLFHLKVKKSEADL